MIKVQMAQFGQNNASDKELEDIVARVYCLIKMK